jgi:hypothetical protein
MKDNKASKSSTSPKLITKEPASKKTSNTSAGRKLITSEPASKKKSGFTNENQFKKGGKMSTMKKAKAPMMKYGGKMGKKPC